MQSEIKNCYIPLVMEIAFQPYINFIEQQLQELSDYDARRPEGHPYEFHLHSKRVAESMKALAKKVGYDCDMCEALYWATLPHDIGKMILPVEIWDLEDKPTENQRGERRTHTWRGVEIFRAEFGEGCDADPFLKLLIDIMENHHETLNGEGFLGKAGDQLSKEVRMACICDAFDGWSVYRPHFGDRNLSPETVIKRMETEKAGQFDPDLLKQFKEIVVKE